MKKWTRQQLLVAFNLYCQLPFGKLDARNSQIIHIAGLIERTPSALAMKLANIASLDPEIRISGRRGLTGASAADRAMWQEMQNDWTTFYAESHQAMVSLCIESCDRENMASALFTEERTDYTGSERVIETATRVGQGFFRRAVLSAYDYKCCITGLSLPKLLIASHIVPWKTDAANRLNPRNGLALSMLHDKAFDAGLLTVNEDMTLRVSRKCLPQHDVFFHTALLAYDGKPIAKPNKFAPLSRFLDYHRKHVFEQGGVLK